MGIVYRKAEEKDREACIDFINYVFGHDHRPHDFKTLLPKEYGDGRESKAVHFLAVDDERGIRGVTAVLPLSLRCAGETLSCGFVGSVSVHPYSRGEGHMKKLMAMVNSYMAECGMDLAVLSGARQRYEYYGYSLGGFGITAEFRASNFRHRAESIPDIPLSFVPFDEMSKKDPEKADHVLNTVLLPVYNARDYRVLRCPEEFPDIAKSWSRRMLVLLCGGEPCGYLIADGQNNITELAVRPDSSPAGALKAWQAYTGAEKFTVEIPFWDRDLFETAGWLAEDTLFSAVHNIRVLNWGKTLKTLLKVKEQALGSLADGECAFTADEEPVHICRRGGEAGEFTCDERIPADAPHYSRIEVQNRLFGHGGLLYPENIGGAPAGWFPLYFSIPSTDGF